MTRRLKPLFFALLFVAGHSALGATIYWKGITSDWSTPANWYGNVLPADGDVVNIGITAGFPYVIAPVISVTPAGTYAAVNIGSLVTNTLTINNGATLNANALNMSSTTLGNKLNVNGALNVNSITMSGGILNASNQIVMGSSGMLYLSGAISGGTLVPSTSTTSSIVLDGATNIQNFGVQNTQINGNIGVLDIENTYNNASTTRGVTLNGCAVNHLIVGNGAIFDANGTLVEGTNYYATIGPNARYISKSTFNFHANDNVDASATLEFSSTTQVLNLYKANNDGTNTCPNVLFTGTTITINGGPATYSSTNANNNSNFLVRGNLDITSGTSSVIYNGVSVININGNFTGSNAMTPVNSSTSPAGFPTNIPVNIGGSWTNTASDNIGGIVTYNGTTSGNTQKVATNVAYKSNLVFTGASPKQISSGTLKVAGNLDNSANSSVDFVTNTTTTLMNGTAAQIIAGGTASNNIYSNDVVSGTVFYNLNIATSGSTTASKTTTLSGYSNIAPGGVLSLTVGGGRLDASALNSLTLMSTAGGTANVADLTNNNTTTGTNMPMIMGVTYVQRFITGGTTMSGGVYVYRAYRLLSSPVNLTSPTASTSSSSPNYISIRYLSGYAAGNVTYPGAFTGGAGGTAGGFSMYNANPTIYFYNEKLLSSNSTFTSGKNIGVNYINPDNSLKMSDNTTDNMPVGNGFIMYFIGPSTRTSGTSAIAPTDAMITATGYLNQGTIPVYLWYAPGNGSVGQLSYNYPSVPVTSAGYNMVGNPYPCSINLSTVISDNPGVDAVYLLNDRNPNQAYIACTANGTSAPSSGYAMSGEGFFVHATGPGKTLTFKETEKAPSMQLTGQALILAAAPKQAQPLTGLFMKMEQDSMMYDYCGIYFRNDWSDKLEPGDAKDLDGGNVYMSSYSADGTRMAVNHMCDYQKNGARIKLYADAKSSGLYKLKIEGIRNIDTLYDIYLIDHYKKDSLDIRHYGTYAFNIQKEDSTSFGGSRFELAIRRRPMPPYQLRLFAGQKANAGVKLNWDTSNEGDFISFGLEKLDNSTQQYSTLANQQANGSGTYAYTDANALMTGPNTYRLKQTDVDGHVYYSIPVTISYHSTTNGISLYPNPARESVQFTIAANISDVRQATYVTTIYNAAGIVVMRKTASGNSWSAEVSNLSPGAYTAEIKDNSGSVTGTAKFIKTQ